MDEPTDPAPGHPRDVVVVGSGRSGTSLVTELIGTAGHHLGRHLARGNDANPRGFFEDYRTMLVNEQLLAPYTKDLPEPRFTEPQIFQRPLGDFQRWLAVLWPEVTVQPRPELESRMRASITGSPWCRKDPRFCHTLPAWEPLLGDAVRICVFREPSRTANSMIKVAHQQQVELSFEGGLEVWAAAYLRILRQHRRRGQWVFVHYDQVLDGSGLPRLEEAIGARLDGGVAETGLRRASPDGRWPAPIDEVYRELCEVAGYRPG